MKKKLKKILLLLGGILLFFLLLVAIASLLFFYDKPLIKGILEKQIEKRTGIPITIRTLDYELFPLRIRAAGLKFTINLEGTEVDVSASKLILKGDIHRVRKKVRPYFETVEGEGVRIVSRIEKSRKKLVLEDIFRDLSSGMSYVRKVSFENSSIELDFSGKKLILRGFDFTLAPSGDQDSFAYSFLCRNAEGIGLSRSNRFQNAIQGSGTFSLGQSPAIKGRFVLTSNHFSYAGKEKYFGEIRLNVAGEFKNDKKEFIIPSLGIEIPSFLELSGPLEIISQDELSLFFRPKLRISDLGRMFSLAKDQFPPQLEGLEFNGSALFEGEARITPAASGQMASISGSVILDPSRVKYHTPEYQLDGYISGSLTLDRFPESQTISGRMKIDKSSYTGKSAEASGVNMDIPFVYDHKNSRLDFRNVKASAVTLSMDIPNRTFKTDTPRFSGHGFIDLEERSFRITQANIELEPFPPFEVEARAGLGPLQPISFSAKSPRIDFQTLLGFFSFVVPQKVNDWEPEGGLNVQITAHNSLRERQMVWDVSAELEASDVAFHDPSFTIAGEALQPSLTLEGTFDHTFKDIRFAAEINLSRGESIWKSFYIDWSKMPVLGTISGRFQTAQGKLAELAIQTTIPDLGKIDAHGYLDLLEPRSADFRIEAPALELSTLYAFINRIRGADAAQVKLGGHTESQIDVKIDKSAFSLMGYLRVNDASWKDPGRNFSLEGIEAYIPLFYAQGSERMKDEFSNPERGYVIMQNFRSALLDQSPLRLDFSAKRNGYVIEPLELEIFGRRAEVGETSVEYGRDPANFGARTSFSWGDVDLSKLQLSSQDFRMSGKLSVDFPLVVISSNRVSTEGQSEADVFGGKIAIHNIQVDQPFSESRTISCDVKLSELDLEKITDSIPFGRVTGILNGEIQDLALSYGQPERFNIRIQSEKRKGIPQRFSLKATNDLAILGTGEKTPFSPQSGWTRFVKEFRYKKIGIACSLKNDTFSLSGTIHKKGIEYLVKGSGLFAINVVNKQTQNQIQFKDMLGRLKRIGQSKQFP
jgi:hypothetical protein